MIAPQTAVVKMVRFRTFEAPDLIPRLLDQLPTSSRGRSIIKVQPSSLPKKRDIGIEKKTVIAPWQENASRFFPHSRSKLILYHHKKKIKKISVPA